MSFTFRAIGQRCCLAASLAAAILGLSPLAFAAEAAKATGSAAVTVKADVSPKPDLTGVWRVEKGYAHVMKPDDGKGVPVQKWAYDLAFQSLERARAGKPDLHNDQVCLPPGVYRDMQGAYPFMTMQTPDTFALLFEENSRVIVARMNQTHPKSLRPSWYGDSIAYWEGDTLVMDTVGMTDKTPLVANVRTEIPHTEALHLIQRFRVLDGGKRLENRTTIDDPKTFTRPFDVTTYYGRLEPSNRLIEHVCADNYMDYN